MLPALPLIMGGCHARLFLYATLPALSSIPWRGEIVLETLFCLLMIWRGGNTVDCRSIRASTFLSFFPIIIIPFNGKHP